MSGIQSESIIIEKTVRYSCFGNPETANYLIIALHGYGQLSKYFIQKFIHLNSDYFIIAPEGMHRFYLNGTTGRVGASWMTREAREEDISDNLNYLDQLLEITKKYTFEKKILLGFSQGGATAARYLHLGKTSMDHFILWASVFPPDLEINNEIRTKSGNSKNYFVVGNEDDYFTDESRAESANYFSNMNYSVINYAGNHSIDPDVLDTILKEIK